VALRVSADMNVINLEVNYKGTVISSKGK
jgi:hypothetical protein